MIIKRIEDPEEYRVSFIKVKDLDELNQYSSFEPEDLFGSIKIENNLYAILIDKDFKVKDPEILNIPRFASRFKKIYYSKLEKGPLEYVVFGSLFSFYSHHIDFDGFDDILDYL